MPKRITHILITACCLAVSACCTTPAGAREHAAVAVPGYRFADITPFTKWTGMLERAGQSPEPLPGPWQEQMAALHDMPLKKAVRAINDAVNDYRYIDDMRNWGREDYWETPREFAARGGDCEDFAIAKYLWLRALGIAEENLRLAVVYDDKLKGTHTLLVVDSDDGPLVLDNQIRDLDKSTRTRRYRPIYSINREAWWLQTTDKTVVADALRGVASRVPAGGK